MAIQEGGGIFGLGNLGGGGVHSDPGNPGGRGDQKTLPSVGGVWIFSGITHYKLKDSYYFFSLRVRLKNKTSIRRLPLILPYYTTIVT